MVEGSVVPSPYEDGVDAGRHWHALGHRLAALRISAVARLYSTREYDQRQYRLGILHGYEAACTTRGTIVPERERVA